MMSEGKRRFWRVIFGGEAAVYMVVFFIHADDLAGPAFPWRALLCLFGFAVSGAAFLLVGRWP